MARRVSQISVVAPMLPGVSTPQPRRPRGSTAVMAAHAPAEVAGDDELSALYRRLEYFPTPPWAGRAGGELIQALDPGDWECWEPACGEGHLAHGLADYFVDVRVSDIHDHGRGEVLDFTSDEAGVWSLGDPGARFELPQTDWIMTNPPFGRAADFVRLALPRARRGVAMLCRSMWRETSGRYPLFHHEGGCDLEGVFYDRVNMNLGRWVVKSTEKGGSTATPYSWFVWFKDAARPPQLAAARELLRELTPEGQLLLPAWGIAPGSKARLTRPEDAARFGWKGEAALLEHLEGAD